MTVWRASTVAFLAALAVQPALTQPSAAQQPGPPVRLVPPSATPAPTPAPAEAAPAARPAEEPASQIEVSQPAPIDTAAVGLAEPAALRLPPTPWSGTSRTITDPLMEHLPNSGISRPARDLAERLLTVSAPPPAEAPKSADSKSQSYVALRAAKLMAMGEVEAATGLARLIPGRTSEEALARVLLDGSFEAYDNAGACALVRSQVSRFTGEYWQKALIFCQALANEHGRAQLGVTMLREQNMLDDPFARLIATLGGDTRSPVDKLTVPTPLHLAMMRAARQNLPADLATSSDPLLLRMVATSPNATSEMRVVAAERAEAFGALSAEVLAPMYDSFTFTPEQLNNAASIATDDRGPRGRAALHRAAKAQPPGAARAEILQKGWRLARERGGYATAVRVDLPLLQEINPDPELMFFAVDATRALLLNGRVGEARNWYTMVRTTSISGNELATTAQALLWPLMWIADLDERKATQGTIAAQVEAWRKVQQRLDAGSLPRRSALLTTLLLGNGSRPEPALIAPLLSGEPAREAMPMPSVGLWLAFGSALESGRSGEAALLALNILGAEGAAGASPHTVAFVLDGLRAVSLDDDARAISLETAIAAGL
jgi:hypothetical protein